ncbi:hypothetical protein ERJ75_001658500 [Trypanosoma vivax]|nr:hypothetical protein ERJ75_001658500 [Trypanosoma vivax]
MLAIPDGARRTSGTSTAQKRIYWLIGVGAFSIVAALIVIATSLLIYDVKYGEERRARMEEEITITDQWASLFRSITIDVIAASQIVEGFVIGGMKSLPSMDDPPEKRIKGQNFSRLHALASKMTSEMPSNFSVMLAPGGIVSQTFPDVPSLNLLDLFSVENQLPSMPTSELMESKKYDINGPMHRRFPQLPMKWQLILRNPVFDASHGNETSHNGFWGFVVIVNDLDALMDSLKLDERLQEINYDYIIYVMQRGDGTMVKVRTSLAENSTVEDYTNFIKSCVNRPVLRHHTKLFICMRNKERDWNLPSSLIVTIVLGAVLGGLLIFLVATFFVLSCLQDYDGREHAPKSVPFAMAVIGPSNVERMLEMAPEATVLVLERLSKLQQRAVVNNRAYVGSQLHPYTLTVVTRSVDASIQLCLDILRDACLEQIDKPLQNLLGDDGKLLISGAVHWCMDAHVRVETVSGSIRYEGPDIIYVTHMWVLVPPNKVTISHHAKDAILLPQSERCICPIGGVFFRGVKKRQMLYTVVPTGGMQSWVSSAVGSERNTGVVSEGPPLSNMRETTQNVLPSSFRNVLACSSRSATQGEMLMSEESNGVTLNEHGPGGEGSVGKKSGQSIFSTGHPRGAGNGKHVQVPPTLVEMLPCEVSLATRESEGRGTCDRVQSPVLSSAFRSEADVNDSKFHSIVWQNCRGPLYSNRTGDKNSSNKPTHGATPDSKSEMSDCGSQRSAACLSTVGSLREFCESNAGDFVTAALLRPSIPQALDSHLRGLFDQYSLALDFGYSSVRIVIYYFYCAYQQLLKPLAGPERTNIFNRFATAFGVSHQSMLESLAVRCALRHIQHLERMRALLWHSEQERLQTVAEGDGTVS